MEKLAKIRLNLEISPSPLIIIYVYIEDIFAEFTKKWTFITVIKISDGYFICSSAYATNHGYFLFYFHIIMLDIIINSFWLIIPAYCANFFPVLLRGRHPIDFGRKFIDGFRLFGDGKTIEGFFGGIFFGILVGLLLIYSQPLIQNMYPLQFQHDLLSVFLLTTGAVTGDMIGSFIKRRFGIKRGDSAPLLDQLDFLIFSLVMLSIISTLNIYWVIFLAIVTPLIHYSSNICAFLLKLKNEPY